jgi:uncharacterized membrane protein YccC
MRNLSPQRRAAVIAGACAAIVPSTALLMEHTHSKMVDFAGGLIVGVAFALTVAFLIRTRRACS